MWIVYFNRSPDPEENSAVGPFGSSEEAQGYIEMAHDPDFDCPDGLECVHPHIDDVDWAVIVFMNEPPNVV